KEYENRLRRYSRPEKIFQYFATVKTLNDADQWEIFMTPVDFLRAIMPGLRQPAKLGLHKYRKMSRETSNELSFKTLPEDSIFYKLRPNGLLTFAEYLHLWMIMQMPERYLRIGFSLFDKSGNGKLSKADMNLILIDVVQDERFKKKSAVNHYLFGPNLDRKVSLDKLLEFKRQLNRDVLHMQFTVLQHKDKRRTKKKSVPEDTISELVFADLLLTYSSQTRFQRVTALQRIKKKYLKSRLGVTRNEFLSFHQFLQNLSTIDVALTYYYMAGADISRETLQHISNVVVGAPLSPHIIDIIFEVFDHNDDGILKRTEF
ncbi:hypothetical protein KR222_005020, partial [Zaprionus bogoriensis]